MNSFLLSVAALLFLALSAAFAVPYFIDWNGYRDVFEAQASKMLGRPVAVGGDVRLILLPVPYVRFEDVRIADENGRIDAPFAKARSFRAWLAVPPLLSGKLEAKRVEIDHPVLNVTIAEDGTGSWSKLALASNAALLMPQGVTLDEVNITGGHLVVHREGWSAPVEFEAIEGTLSVRSLDGPIRFQGAFTTVGETYELRFNTGRREGDGSMRWRSVLRDAAGTRNILLDGQLPGSASVASYKGKLIARFARQGERLSDEAKPNEPGNEPALEIRAEVNANFHRAEMEKFEITIPHAKHPQTIAGRLEADWRNGLLLGTKLSSRWVDLDALRESGTAGPAQSAAQLANELLARLAAVRQAKLDLKIDQALLGGDIVQDLHLVAGGEGKTLAVIDLSGRLPGDNDLAMSGELRAATFTGQARLNGRRLGRLLRWLSDDAGDFGGAEAGDYALDARVALSGEEIALANVKGAALGTAFSGDFRYRGGPKPELALQFASDRLDVEKLLGEQASARAIWSLFSGKERSQSEGLGLPWLANADARVDLSVAAMKLPRLGDSNLVARFTLAGGKLEIQNLNLSSQTGVTLRGDGQLAGIGTTPDGRVSLAVEVKDAAGLEALTKFLELPESYMPKSRLEALAPMQLALAVQSQGRQARELEIRGHGTAGKSDINLTLAYRGDLAELDKGEIDIAFNLSGASGKAVLSQLFPKLQPAQLIRLADGKGMLALAARGVSGTGLASKLTLDAGGLNFSYEGESTFGAGLTLSGRAATRAADASLLLALSGVNVQQETDKIPVSIAADIKKSLDGPIELGALKGQLGSQLVTGSGRLAFGGAKPVLEANLKSGAADLASLFAPLIVWGEPPGADALVQGLAVGPSHWPDRRFDLALLDAFNGKIALATPRLELLNGLVLSDAAFEASLADGALTVSSLKGGLFGGKLDASGKLARRGGSIVLNGKADAKAMRLDRMATQGSEGSLARGPVDLQAALSSEGLTPAGLAAALSGEGKLIFGKSVINHLSPQSLASVIETAQKGKTQPAAPPPDNIAKLVRDRLLQGEFPVAGATVPFTIRNGTVRLDKVALDSAGGEAVVTAYLELASLRLDSEWQLSPKAARKEDDDARVTMLFAGSAFDFGSLTPVIDTQPLERFLTLKRMERDVEQLEELDLGGGRGNKTQQKTKPGGTSGKTQEQTPKPPGSEAAIVTKPLPPVTDAPPAARSEKPPAQQGGGGGSMLPWLNEPPKQPPASPPPQPRPQTRREPGWTADIHRQQGN